MQKDKDTIEDKGASGTGWPQRRDAVYKPLDMAMAQGFDIDKHLEAAQFDVVIADLMMEEMTGVEFLRHIQLLSPGIQVILISRMETINEFVKDMKNELFDYFPKPVNEKKLKESVKHALEVRMMI